MIARVSNAKFRLISGKINLLSPSISSSLFVPFVMAAGGDSIIANSSLASGGFWLRETPDGELPQLRMRYPFTRFDVWGSVSGSGVRGWNKGVSGSAPGGAWQPGGANYAAVTATAPKVVFLDLGVNAYLSSGSTIWSGLAPTISGFVAVGIAVIVGTIRPWVTGFARSTDGGSTTNARGNTPTQQNVMDANALIRANAPALGTVAAPVGVADVWAGWMTAFGYPGEVTTYRSASALYYNDGQLHPNKTGAVLAVSPLLTALASIGVDTTANYAMSVLLPRTNLLGTASRFPTNSGGTLSGAGVSGAAPYGVTVAATAGLVSNVAISASAGSLYLNVTIPPGSSTVYESVRISVTSVAAATAGQWISSFAKVRKLNTFGGWSRVELWLAQTGAYSTAPFYWTSTGSALSSGTTAEGLLPGVIETLYPQTPPIQANGSSGNAGQTYLEVGWSPSQVPSGGTGQIAIDLMWAGQHDDPSAFYAGK